jgi:hypothetical protein
VRAAIAADSANQTPIDCRLYIRTYGANDELEHTSGPATTLAPGAEHQFVWRIGATGGAPIAEIGVELSAIHQSRQPQRADGSVYLDYLTWDGEPGVVLTLRLQVIGQHI